MGQVDAQARFYRRLFGKKATPTLEDVPAHAVPTLAAAFAYLATKDGWRLGPIPMGIWATAALVMYVGSDIAVYTLLGAVLPEEGKQVAMWLYPSGLFVGWVAGFASCAVGWWFIRSRATKELLAGDAQPVPDSSGPLDN